VRGMNQTRKLVLLLMYLTVIACIYFGPAIDVNID